jgi:exodeoxyribonuclease V alpha subunit
MVIPILTRHYILLRRNLVYTGVARGKKPVVIIGTKRR